jgi:uncharacterized protein (TIGR02231 family)
MRLRFAAFILVSTAFTPALAADIKAVSHIETVTVFPLGAEVTRLAEVGLEAGDHTLIFENLPAELDPRTIRVEGEGGRQIEIASVDSRLITAPSEAQDVQRKRIEKDIETLYDERSALDQAIGDAEYQKSLMQQLASATLTAAPKEGETRILDAEGLGGLLDLVGGKLSTLSKAVHDARLRQRDIDRLVQELQQKLNALAPGASQSMRISVHLAAPAATSGRFKLRYRVGNAGWRPIYDARLASPAKETKAKIELVRRAEVMQSTTESWDNVALILSTARPLGATSAPELQPMAIDDFSEGRRENYSSRGRAGEVEQSAKQAGAAIEDSASKDKERDDLAAAIQMQAQVEVAGFQALYSISGRATIDNTGTAKKVRIGTDEIAVELSARAAPRIDPNAYLTAAFTLSGDTPLLPGAVMLYRDGVYVGEGALPMLAPGEEAKLGFGADDLIKVKRIEVNRRLGEEGLLTTTQVDERAFDITIKNLHDATIPVTLLDQLPYSNQEKVNVETLSGMTAPTVVDFERRRGVLAWTFDLEPQAVKVIKHGYRVSWPADMQVGWNDR